MAQVPVETIRRTRLTNESEEYLAKREELRVAELELMRARERVLGIRRRLPKGGEDAKGNQDSTISVFTRESNGVIRHFYTTHPSFSPEIREHGMDLLMPVYNVLDLTPQERGEWVASLSYSPHVLWEALNAR